MARRIGALLGVAVILLIAAACGSGDDGAASEPPPSPAGEATAERPEPAPLPDNTVESVPEPPPSEPAEPPPSTEPSEPPPSIEQDAVDWVNELSQVAGQFAEAVGGQSVEFLTCFSRNAREAVVDYSECRSLVIDTQEELTAMRDALDGAGPPPEGAEFAYEGFDQFLRDTEEATNHLLAGIEADDPTSAESIRRFDQSDVLVRRARAAIFAVGVRAFELSGDELPERLEEGINTSVALYAEETYDPYFQADFEYLQALEDEEASIEEIVALAQKARSALDDHLAALRSMPVPGYEPFATSLRSIEEAWAAVSESYTVAIDGLDTLDEQRLNETDQLRADAFLALSEASIEFERLLMEVIAAQG